MVIAAGKKVETTVSDLEPGTYYVAIEMEEYDGGFAAEVFSVDGASTVSLKDDWIELLGLVITVGGFATGGVLYLRRSRLLKREIHRIDHIYAAMHADIASCRLQLLQLREELKDRLVRRKMSEQQFSILDRRIDHHLRELPTSPAPPQG